MTATERPIRPRGRPQRDIPIEPEIMRRRPKPQVQPKPQPRAAKKAQKRSPYLTFFTVLLLLVIAAVLFWLVAGLFGGMLTLQTVAVEWPEGDSSYVSDESVMAAAGLTVGDGIYALRTAEIARQVCLANPYLAEVRVERRLPDTVAIICIPREAAYYIEVGGEYFALSTDLTVLERQRSASVYAGRGLVELILPDVNCALVGLPLGFTRPLDVEALSPLFAAHRTSPLFAETDLLRIDDPFNVSLIVRGNFAVTMGDCSDVEHKLMMVEQIIDDEMFGPGGGGFINVTNPARSRAIADQQTDYSTLWRS